VVVQRRRWRRFDHTAEGLRGSAAKIAIRIQKRIESETLHLPELRPLIGREVEIIVHETEEAAAPAGTGDWEAAARAARELQETGYDFDAWRDQREYDLKHSQDRLP
jgi:hypothetical protein